MDCVFLLWCFVAYVGVHVIGISPQALVKSFKCLEFLPWVCVGLVWKESVYCWMYSSLKKAD